ncbi:flagellar protein FlaF [Pseudoxanthobacter soli DSM 19599]|uniref:Flagellar protein FlaF n=1 Tax=Pseudoxanthobacter soli DSM 19599 TaxID=1123029 RepID=A0A1M7ZEB0_9HYPH|nr:flagellar biosynthesis regulator FlaF [Pseudoxanthobacter soli]SHO63217.1 flagellar protein FlaF [Pseudoxanthobacter soli DSM 19599]
MYRFSYAEIVEDSSDEGRSRERMAFEHAIYLLEKAEPRGLKSSETLEAAQFVQKMWSFLISDLSSGDNGLAESVRADLMSIGLWVIRQADHLIHERAVSLDALITVHRTIRDGLQ